VSLTGPTTVIEGNTTTPYTISVDQPAGDVTTPITVTFTYSGVAVDGTDFTGQASVQIPAGSNSNTFTIDTLDDVLAEGAESFTIAIDTITDTNFEHIAEDATNNSVETQITDNDHVPVAVDDPEGVPISGGLASEYYGYREGIDGGNLATLQEVKDYVAANDAEITFTSTQINYGYTDTNSNNRYDTGEAEGNGDLADDVAASGGVPSNLEWFLKQDAASIEGTSTEEATDGVIHMSGLIDIPADGSYTFDVHHDDGFVIYIDGVDIFEYDTITSPTESIKTVDLTGGQHTVEVYYWDQGGQYIFDLQLLDSSDNNVWVTENLSTPVSSPITTNEETAVLIDLDDNDFDADGDLDPDSIVIQSNPGNGSVVVNGDGTVTYTPNANFYGVDTFTYTIKDFAGHESNVATVTVAVNPINDIPQLSVQGPLSLSEEAIPSIGVLEADDSGDTASASGVITIVDPDNSDFAISLSGPTGVTSDGSPVTWTWVADTDESNSIQGVLTGTSSAGVDVATVTLNDTVDNGNGNYSAQYDVNLLAGIDHETANGENNETLTFEATVSDGLSAPQSVNLVVNVEDDTVNAFDITQSLVGEQDTITTNLVLVLDRSGSMADDFYNDGLYYLEIARDALKQLIDSADGAGNVNVMIVDFSSNTDSSGWVVDDVAAAYEYLDNIIANGGTEYDTALNSVMSEYQLTTPPPADQTFSYFVTDGVPNNSHSVDSSVTYTPEGSSSSLSGPEAWEAFLDDSGITESYAIGIGNVLSNSSSAINHLNDVAHSADTAYVDANDSNTAEENTILLSDPNDLANALLEAFSNDSITGTVESTLGAAGNSGFLLGADGGQVVSITINDVKYSYDPDTDVMSADPVVSLTGLVSGANNEILTVETDIGGDMMLNFITGEYSYSITVTTALLGSQELFDLQAIDNDGDEATLAMKLDLDFTAQLDANRDNVITNVADGTPVVIPEIAIIHNDQEDGGVITSVDNALGGIVNDAGDIIFTRGGGLSESDFSTSTAAAIITEDESASPNNTMANAVDMTDRSLFSSNNSNLSGLNQSGYAAAFIGQLSSSNDEDWFEITLAEGESIHFDIDNASINTSVSVYDAQGNFVTTIGENNGSAYDDYTADADGNYFVKVDSPNNGVGSYELYMAIDTSDADYTAASFEYTLGSSGSANTDSTIVDITTVSGNSLVGTEFDDILLAGTGDDSLSAGDGDDVLIGGEGNDILTGGAGEDLFVWSKSDLGTGTNPTVDQITDFNTAENDVIDLSDVLSDGSHTLDAVMNSGHLQLTITDSSSNEVVQRVDVNNLSVSNDAEAQNLLTTLLTSNNIDDGIV
ncbi:Ig-like domain-containing protein, partial [Neptuniibacter sp. 1_MG-2023]|uniref:Ig-like domain-containing protein n=1 Tax=Neptuniibacter sp. 1_MG-2023 TaxID=3062662 RepID=UPI0026E2504C